MYWRSKFKAMSLETCDYQCPFFEDFYKIQDIKPCITSWGHSTTSFSLSQLTWTPLGVIAVQQIYVRSIYPYQATQKCHDGTQNHIGEFIALSSFLAKDSDNLFEIHHEQAKVNGVLSSLELLALGNSNTNSDPFVKAGKAQLMQPLNTTENIFIEPKGYNRGMKKETEREGSTEGSSLS